MCVALVASSGCNRSASPAAAKTEPAEVDHHVDENSLNTITLTPRAEQRLGIQTAEARWTDVVRRRTYGGEVTLPPGRMITVTAPLAGTLSSPPGATSPAPGSHLDAGQVVFGFTPLLTPEREVLTPAERITVAQTKANVVTAQIEAERQVQSAGISIEAAQIVHDRAVQLLKDKAGSQRSVDEAEANLKLAREALITAQTRFDFLNSIELDSQPGELQSRDIESPAAGILQAIDSAPGETVAAGDPLFSVITTTAVWIRVAVYVGQWREIDTSKPASVVEYGEPPSASRPAEHVTAPPTANAVASTVDVYYQLSNPDGKLYPGQKLAVTVPLRSAAERLVVPFKAIVYDVHGGAWVYARLDAYTYARHRVSVAYIDGEDAVLAAGLELGQRVVTDGAAELFGTEFEVGH